jgi:dTDP-4-amino-4,6-dideoxygalactose transaminase
LRKLDDWIDRRARNSMIMQDALRGIRELRVPSTPNGHAHYRCMAYTHSASDRPKLLSGLAQAGLPANIGSCSEIYREPIFARHGIAPHSALPVAHALGETSLAFLVHHTIDEVTMHRYAAKIAQVLRQSAQDSQALSS